MKFPYMAIPTRQPVPSLGGLQVRHRPVLAVLLAGSATPQLRDGLLDTGADDTVFSDAVAAALGIDLAKAEQRSISWRDGRSRSCADISWCNSGLATAKLRRLAINLGFAEREIEGKYLGFTHGESGWFFATPTWSASVRNSNCAGSSAKRPSMPRCATLLRKCHLPRPAWHNAT